MWQHQKGPVHVRIYDTSARPHLSAKLLALVAGRHLAFLGVFEPGFGRLFLRVITPCACICLLLRNPEREACSHSNAPSTGYSTESHYLTVHCALSDSTPYRLVRCTLALVRSHRKSPGLTWCWLRCQLAAVTVNFRIASQAATSPADPSPLLLVYDRAQVCLRASRAWQMTLTPRSRIQISKAAPFAVKYLQSTAVRLSLVS